MMTIIRTLEMRNKQLIRQNYVENKDRTIECNYVIVAKTETFKTKTCYKCYC